MACVTSLARRFLTRSAVMALVLGLAFLLPSSQAAPLPDDLETSEPKNIEELKAIQKQVKIVLEKAVPCTVCLVYSDHSGSGVIISSDGYILTAGHVSGKPGQDVDIILSDGKHIKGKSLGQNTPRIDSGMVKITTEEPKGGWPHCEMGENSTSKKGQWVISVGHPGGYKKGRSPVVRLGRLQRIEDTVLTSDCTLVGGDSGGPLFDLEGKVVGIHSRIGNTLATNMHVPVDTYRYTWDRLASGESWSGGLGKNDVFKPYIGIKFEPDAENCKIAEVSPNSPAAKAGLKVNDVVMQFDGQAVANYDELAAQLKKKKIGDEVALEITRDKETIKIKLTIGKIGKSAD